MVLSQMAATTQALEIRGSRRLTGTVAASGGKNAALAILATSIMAQGPVVLEGVPQVGDVHTMLGLLQRLGSQIAVHRCGSDGDLGPYWLHLQHPTDGDGQVDADLVRQMRAGFCLLGPLVARYGRACIAMPGGCRIGPRPVELHLAGLSALGAKVEYHSGFITATASKLRGAVIDLTGPCGSTVTGTINVMAAATLATGRTIIRGAALEPEVVDAARFLNSLGADIRGAGSSTLEIHGVDCLGGGSYRAIPDRVEAATLLIAGAITAGEVTVTGVTPRHLDAVCRTLREAGAEVELGLDRVTVAVPRPLNGFRVTAEPYPGLPTDLQAPLTALAAVAQGRSVLRDRVFPHRFAHLTGLRQLGARVARHGDAAVVDGGGYALDRQGVTQTVAATDLRGAAALVLAGLARTGFTQVCDIAHLDRGYQHLEAKLASLGADIARVAVAADDTARLMPLWAARSA